MAAQYCVFCDRSFVSFTQLRHHKCSPTHQVCAQPIDIDSEEEKENWMQTSFKLVGSVTSSDSFSVAMEEIKAEYEYTVEMNEDVDKDIENSPTLRKMLEGKSRGTDEMLSENVAEDCLRDNTEACGNADYVYVLEPDDSVDLNLENGESIDKNDTKNGDKQSKSNLTSAIDLSSLNKRKRKSNLDGTLSNILKTKSVVINQDSAVSPKESQCEEFQANKIHVIEKREPESNIGNLNHENGLSDLVTDLSIKRLNNHSQNTPKVSSPALSTPKTGSSRKNRRKCSVPVRCEKNEEIGDMNDIMEEYGVQPDIKVNTAVKDLSVKVSDGPIDLTPKSKSVYMHGSSAEKSDNIGPIDLTSSVTFKAFEHTVKSEPIKHEDNQPVDLSKPAASSVVNGTTTNGGRIPTVQPNARPFDPIQMRQVFETMYKMQSQFPNQNFVQAQLMQFHALMQNAMLNGSVMQMNNMNGLKSNKSVKSDKNDNIIKTESGLQNDQWNKDLQNDQWNKDLQNDQWNKDLQKFSLDFMQKNGLIQNNFPHQFSVSPGSPFSPDQGNQFKNRSSKKKNKAPLVMNDSSMDSVKLEGSTPLVELESRHGPEQIVETLQQYFPIIPTNNLPKTQLHNDSNGVKFFVKDNEQIRVIVDSLLQVGLLDLDEQKGHGTEPVFKYICRVCNQTFFHVEHLTKHVKKHHVVKKYQCSECDRSFHDAGNYRQHMRVHDETDIPYECPECKRRFRHKCTLKVHMRIHTGEKPFKCDICGATFKISSGLQTHMRKHTGETPYACEFCDLRFKCQSNLKQHLFQHTQVRPFPCEICGKTYSRKSIRDAHLLTHTKDAAIKNEHVKKWIDDLPQPVPVGGNE